MPICSFILAGRPELKVSAAIATTIASTNYQLFRQLVAHFEHELGHPWPDLVDHLAGGGIVLAVKIQPKQPAPVLLILQGTDPKLTAQFFSNVREAVADEQARQGVTEEYKSEKYRGVETYHIGENSMPRCSTRRWSTATCPRRCMRPSTSISIRRNPAC